MHTVSQKKKIQNACPYLRQILTDFQNFSTATCNRKLAIKPVSRAYVKWVSLKIITHITTSVRPTNERTNKLA